MVWPNDYTSSVSITVAQQLTSVTVSPASASLTPGGTEQFTAEGADQFGASLATQPGFTWSVNSGGGTVSGSGLYTAPTAPGTAVVQAASGGIGGVAQAVTSSTTVTVWVDDSAPAGAALASDGGDSWTWSATNPAPYSGALDLQSSAATGEHQIYFSNAAATLTVPVGGTLFAYVYLNPANPPQEVMLQWNNGVWDHRAYWGADDITWGTDGTASRYYVGALPATGGWVQLAVPASLVGLDGATLSGMAFTLYGGQADWDYAGENA
jgi:hypothetical protein